MNTTEIIALVGLIATALVSIFSKVKDAPLTYAQAEAAEAGATLTLSQGWRDYANQLRQDNTDLRKEVDDLREEMEAKSRDCADRITELEKQIKDLRSGKVIASRI